MSAWVAVASADHVARGRQGGFMQVNHGKSGPLSRVKPRDTVFYYSPSTQMGGGEKLQAFTAVGVVRDEEPYTFDMGNGFIPTRRNVDWFVARQTPIRPLLERLELTKGKSGWGSVFRFGVVKISDADRDVILEAMGAN
jgi:hypothetical protein